MTRKILTLTGLILLAALFSPAAASAQQAIPLERFRPNVKQVFSRNRGFVADVNFDAKVTRISSIVWQGNMGRSTPVWSMEGAFPVAWLANDGEHLVAGYEGEKLLRPNYDNNQVMLSFFRRGKIISQVRLDQLVRDVSKLEKAGAGYRWARYWGLNPCGHLVLETVEERALLFNIATGQAAKLKSEKSYGATGGKTHRNLLLCHEFQYPADYVLKQDRIFDGSPSPYISLKRAQDKEWLIDASVEDMADYPREYLKQSFAQFVLDRASGMYSADGHDGSTYATGIARERRYRNRDNLEVIEFYLNVTRDTYLEGGKTTSEKRVAGPIYAVSVGGSGEPYRVLFLRPADREESSFKATDILRRIADSVQRGLSDP